MADVKDQQKQQLQEESKKDKNWAEMESDGEDDNDAIGIQGATDDKQGEQTEE
jgi:hypothetical protein